MSKEYVLRTTSSVCPVCLKEIEARVVEDDGKVFIRKNCPEHGQSQCLLSEHAWYYAALDRYFFSVMRGCFKQRDYLIRMTEKCNLQCPICLASAAPSADGSQAPQNVSVTPDMALDKLCAFMDTHKPGSLKIDLISAEPTLCPDLPDFLREIRKRQHISSLHTNGLKLLDAKYLNTLKEAGLDEVFLQCDGFDDDAYMRIRGVRLAEIKLKILDNLRKAGVATSLVMVIMPDCNEKEVSSVLAYARDNDFIKEVMFLGTRGLGFFRESDKLLMPDQVIDIVHEQSKGLCPRGECFAFQKLYFALLSFLGVQKCLYVQHNLLIREKGKLCNISEYINWNKVVPVLDEYPNVRRDKVSQYLWLLKLAFAGCSLKALKFAPDFVSLFIRLKLGWKLRSLPFRPLLIGYITACDPLNVDRQVGRFCGKGELANDIGLNESGSVANIERERWWAAKPKLAPKK